MYFIQTSLQSAPASLPLTTNQLIVQNEIELQEEITQTASRGTKLIIRNRNMMLRMMQYLAILPPSANLRNKKQHYICDNEKATQTLLETQNQNILYCILQKLNAYNCEGRWLKAVREKNNFTVLEETLINNTNRTTERTKVHFIIPGGL